jgi:hypothetical protein
MTMRGRHVSRLVYCWASPNIVGRRLGAAQQLRRRAGDPPGVVPHGVISIDVIPVDVIPVDVIPLDVIPLGVIPVGVIPVGVIPVGVIPGLVPGTHRGMVREQVPVTSPEMGGGAKTEPMPARCVPPTMRHRLSKQIFTSGKRGSKILMPTSRGGTSWYHRAR